MLTFLMGIGALLGAIDCVRGNRWGLGEKFEEGFLCLGAAALSMVGIICIAPTIGLLLKPIVVPVYRLLGADPAMFGSLFANNMGGYSLAMSLAEQEQVGLFSGLIVSSMLGATMVYTIPVGMSMIRKEDSCLFAKGVMLGVIPIPIGSVVGGMMMGLPAEALIRNSIPTILVAGILVVGLLKFQEKLLNGFMKLALVIRWISILSLGAAAFTSMTGIAIIPGMDDIEQGMSVMASMGVVQLGSLPLAALFIRIFQKPLEKAGEKIRVNAVAIGSLPVSCVNVTSTLVMIKDMNPKGIVVAAAWFTNTICVFTAHMAFTSAVEPDLVNPMMAAKLISGVLAVILALIFEKNTK